MHACADFFSSVASRLQCIRIISWVKPHGSAINYLRIIFQSCESIGSSSVDKHAICQCQKQTGSKQFMDLKTKTIEQLTNIKGFSSPTARFCTSALDRLLPNFPSCYIRSTSHGKTSCSETLDQSRISRSQ